LELGKNLGFPRRSHQKVWDQDSIFRFVAFLAQQLDQFGNESPLAVDWKTMSPEAWTHLIRIYLYEDRERRPLDSFALDMQLGNDISWMPKEIYEILHPEFVQPVDPEAEFAMEGPPKPHGPRLSMEEFQQELIFIQQLFRRASGLASDPKIRAVVDGTREILLSTRSLLQVNQASAQRMKSMSSIEDAAPELYSAYKRYHRLQSEYEISTEHLRLGMKRLGDVDLAFMMGDLSEFFEDLRLKDRALPIKVANWLGAGIKGGFEFVGGALSGVFIGIPYFVGEQTAVLATQLFMEEEDLEDLLRWAGAWDVFGGEVISKDLSWYDPRRYSLWRMENVNSPWRWAGTIAINVIGARWVTAGMTSVTSGAKWMRKDPSFKGFVTANTLGKIPGQKSKFYELRAVSTETPKRSLEAAGQASRVRALPAGSRSAWEVFESRMTRPFWLFPRTPNLVQGAHGQALSELSRTARGVMASPSARISEGLRAAGQTTAIMFTHATALTLLMGVPQLVGGTSAKNFIESFPEQLGTTTALIATLMLTHGRFNHWSRRHMVFAFANYGMSKGLMYYIMKELAISGATSLDYFLDEDGIVNEFAFKVFVPLVEEALNIELENMKEGKEVLFRDIPKDELHLHPEAYRQYQEYQEAKMNFWSHVVLVSWLMSSPRIGEWTEKARTSRNSRGVDAIQYLFPKNPQGTREQMVDMYRSHTIQHAEGRIAQGVKVEDAVKEASAASTRLYQRIFTEGGLDAAIARTMVSGQGRGPTRAERELILKEARQAADRGITEGREVLLSLARQADLRGPHSSSESFMAEMTNFIRSTKEIDNLLKTSPRTREEAAIQARNIEAIREQMNSGGQNSLYQKIFVTSEGQAWLRSLRDTVMERAVGRETQLRHQGIDHMSLTPQAQVFEALFYRNIKERLSPESLLKELKDIAPVGIDKIEATAVVHERMVKRGRRMLEEHEVWTNPSTPSEKPIRMGRWYPKERRWLDENGLEFRYRGREEFSIEFGARGEVQVRVGERHLEISQESIFYRLRNEPALEIGWIESEMLPVFRSMNLRTSPSFWERVRGLQSGEKLHRPSPIEETMSLREKMEAIHLNFRETEALKKGKGVPLRPEEVNYVTYYRGTFQWMGRKITGYIRVEFRGGTVRTIFPDGSEMIRLPVRPEVKTQPAQEQAHVADYARLLEAQSYERFLVERQRRLEMSREDSVALARLEMQEKVILNQQLQRALEALRQEKKAPEDYVIVRLPAMSSQRAWMAESRSLSSTGEYRVVDRLQNELRFGGLENGNFARNYLKGSDFLVDAVSLRQLSRLSELAVKDHALPMEAFVREIARNWSHQIREARTGDYKTSEKKAHQMTEADVLSYFKTLGIEANRWKFENIVGRERLIQEHLKSLERDWPLDGSALSPVMRFQGRKAASSLMEWLHKRSMAEGL
jgi:hypothetical protein